MRVTGVHSAAGQLWEVPGVGVADSDAAQARRACGREAGPGTRGKGGEMQRGGGPAAPV